jgi:pimeloyl-ACP methyl ester carboxylesterase
MRNSMTPSSPAPAWGMQTRNRPVSARRLHGVAAAIAALALAGVLSGCTIVRGAVGFKRQLERVKQYGRIEGNVRTQHGSVGALVVLLVRETADEKNPFVPTDTYVRLEPGSYAFFVAPGTYRVGAYEDRNHNRKYDPDESAVLPRAGRSLTVVPRGVAHEDILIPTEGRIPGLAEAIDVFGLVARTPEEQRAFSLWAWTAQGEICSDLDAAKFGAQAGARGLWRIDDFLNDGVMGIYFMEPYDPDRIPVLFVHGISGFPQQFSALIDSLDRERFQAWFYFYPSGFDLGFPPQIGISGHLATLIERLQAEYGFGEMAIVAHSMGGLVARGALLKYYERTKRDDIRLLISISTPWGGATSATRAKGSPIELPLSFREMNPDSDYLRWIFYTDAGKTTPRSLPPDTEFDLLFGFRKAGVSSVSDDGTVALVSALRMEAQRQARTLRGYDDRHTDILHDSDVISWVNRLLAERFH